MAVIFDPKDKDKNQNQPQFGAATGVSSPIAPTTPQATSSGRFTNIQNYLNANKPAGQALAQNIGGQIEQKGQGIRQELGTAQQQFQQQAAKGRLDRATVAPEAQQIVQRAGQPGFETDVDRFRRITSGQYQGPKELEGAANLQSRGQEVESLGRNLGTSGGRTQVLGQLYGGQGYTGGQRRLDDLLISQNTNALQRARGLASGLGRTVQQQAGAARGLAGYFGQEAAQVGSEAAQNLSSAQLSDETALTAKQQKAFTDEQATVELLKKQRDDLASGGISRELVDKFGLGSIVGQKFDPRGQGFAEGFEAEAYDPYRQSQNIGENEILTYGLDPSQMFSVKDSSGLITRENIASKEQAARLNALARLGNMGNVIDESQAGTFSGSSIELDPEFLAKREVAAQQVRDMISEARGEGERMRNISIPDRQAGRFYDLTGNVARRLRSKLQIK